MKSSPSDSLSDSALSRRKFLGQASCAGVGSASLFSTLFQMQMANVASAQSAGEDDYKALVCLFFAGGIDSFNLLVPRGDTEYAEYAGIRSDLALPQNALAEINTPLGDGRSLGLHPAMSGVADLINAGNATMVSNVGTLVEPNTTLARYQNGTAKLPFGIFSHADQIAQWQTSLPDSRTATGWGGRIADFMQAANENQQISMNISISGNNVFQTGQTAVPFSSSPYGGGDDRRLHDFRNDEEFLSQFRTPAITSLLDEQYQSLFQQNFVNSLKSSVDANDNFSEALSGVNLAPTFGNGYYSRLLRNVAEIIAARDTLNVRRQTFFVMIGGWDHHDEVINSMQNQLTGVNTALTEFWAALTELGVTDQVTTFTASDFARTLTSNGRGSDHAWGGNHIVMGGAVNGNQIYGDYPSLFEGNDLDTGRGRLIPTTSCDEYFAELAQWFGVPQSELPNVLPNLSRFHAGPLAPLGFMNNA